jgi:hypothetical protein
MTEKSVFLPITKMKLTARERFAIYRERYPHVFLQNPITQENYLLNLEDFSFRNLRKDFEFPFLYRPMKMKKLPIGIKYTYGQIEIIHQTLPDESFKVYIEWPKTIFEGRRYRISEIYTFSKSLEFFSKRTKMDRLPYRTTETDTIDDKF